MNDLTPLQKAFLVIEKLESERDALERSRTEPIAIIGMGCCFPGGAENPESFWTLLQQGKDAISEIPPDRWNVDRFYDPDPNAVGKMYCRHIGFVDRLQDFDADFFGISPREACSLDPQHRLLLEVAWEALESASLTPDALSSLSTGVFVGICSNDYTYHLLNRGEERIDAYLTSGNSHSTAAGRLSYLLGLTGPCLAVDTACSSSLVAIHLACSSLRNRECDTAIASGVNRILSPVLNINFCKARMLAADGRCKTFDIRADGFVRSEGCGAIVLKRLCDARRDGDNILALIGGSAINQDGRTSSLTVPNGLSQQAVIRQALQAAGVHPSQVSYVEAHGTGTSLGDPIEVGALGAIFGVDRTSENPLAIGSVKTNIGHLEAAAGIAGLIKVVLQLQHREIASHLHLRQPNPYIDWESWSVKIPTKPLPWARGEEPRIAGVSSFGFSGTNAHVIVQEAPVPVFPRVEAERPLHLLALSAKSQSALRQLAQEYEGYLKEHPEVELADVCFSSNIGRVHFDERLALVGGNRRELLEQLKARQLGEITPPVSPVRGDIGILFTGQGSQYAGMGQQLYETQPTFRKTLEHCAEILNSYLDKPLESIIYPAEGEEYLLDQTAYTQPALFAVEYALYQLWQSWGIQPAAVMGHSVGEYVAACVAGVFSLEDGLKLIATRGKLMQQLPSGGVMVSLMASVERVKEAIAESTEVVIAAINGPESTVLSGPKTAVETVVAQLEARGIETKRLQVSHAFHSRLMQPMLAEFERVARQVNYTKPKLKLISNVTGQVATEEATTHEYWCRHILEPVNFAAGMETLHKQGCEAFLECGPKPILLGMGRQCLGLDVGVWLPSLRPGQEDWQQMLASLGELYARGVKVDWVGFDNDYPQRRKVSLPTYPFQRQRYWIETTPSSRELTSRVDSLTSTHPLLGHKLSLAGSGLYFESSLSETRPSYLRDHRVFNQALFPTTGYLEMALAAGHHLFGMSSFTIEQMLIVGGLVLPSESRRVQTIIGKRADETYSFEIFSLTSEVQPSSAPQWQLHSQGIMRLSAVSNSAGTLSLGQLRAECSVRCDVETHYYHCRQCQIDYGSSFQGLQQLWKGTDKALGQLQLPEILAAETPDYWIHPALLDAALQVLAAVDTDKESTTYLPVAVERFEVYRRPGLELWALGEWQPGNHTSEKKARVTLMDGAGQVIARTIGLRLQAASPEALLGRKPDGLQDWLYEVSWRSQARFGRLESPEFIPTPGQIATRLQPEVKELLVENKNLHQYIQNLVPQLERVSLSFILQALTQLGWSYRVGESIGLAGVAQRLGVVPQHQRLLARLMQILSSEGILKPNQDQWQVLQPLPMSDDPTLQNSPTLERQAEWQLLYRCGSQLSAVLRGAVDPVQLVFPAGDMSTATQLYEDSPGARAFNKLVQRVVTTAVANAPQQRGLRILEIGAGTGGTTSYLLPHLPGHQTQYCFTDVGALFTQKARERFGDYHFVDYQTLDIEQDPSQQGFEAHCQDVVIAANVLHATQNLRQTLANVRHLLAPGGLLVLLEGTHRQRWVDLIFGLLEGWWRFADVELREDYPLLNAGQWQQLLLSCGFSSVAVLPEAGDDLGQAAIVAQVSGSSSSQLSSSRGWLILADERGVAQQVAERLREQKEVCTLVKIGQRTQLEESEVLSLEPDDVEGYRELLSVVKERMPEVLGVIHCWGLDAPDPQQMDAMALEEASRLGCGTVLSWVKALATSSGEASPRLWIVTQGAVTTGKGQVNLSGVSQSSLWGMGKVIALEHPELRCTCIDLDANASLSDQAASLWTEVWSGDREDQVALRQDERYVARLVDSKEFFVTSARSSASMPDEPYRLELSERGLLDSLQWVPSPRRVPGPGEVEIEVQASGLNFRDVLIALDIYPATPILGGDCAGVIVAKGEGVENLALGDAVIAVAPNSFASQVTVNANLVVAKPKHLSFEEAAAIPINFITAYYALQHLAKLSPGQRVLIHGAAGGTGMAAVQIAQKAGAEVFATASPPKWEVLRGMGVRHIMNSRTTEFAQEVMALTEGQGVDIVLNSLTSGEFIHKSLSVLAPTGCFVEIAVRDILPPEQFQSLCPEGSYFAVDLSLTVLDEPSLIQFLLQQIGEFFNSGHFQPPPLKVFSPEQVVEAFRYMQRAQHIGKIVVTQQPLARAEVRLSGEGTYLITGGLGGLGLLVANWLVEQQVRHLVLVSRRGPSQEAQTQLQVLSEKGAQVVVAIADVSDYGAMAEVIHSIEQSHPPLRGIIHAAGVLDDGTLQQLSWQKFATVMDPKVQGAWNLHQLTRSAQPSFFVLFSSAASMLGSPGQGNHSAANAFLDGLAHYRQSLGLPGQSLNLGAVIQIGEAAERGADVRARQQGMGAIKPQQVLDVLERLLHQPEVAQVGLVPIDWSNEQLPRQWVEWSYLSDWTASGQQTTVAAKESEFVQQLRVASAPEQKKMLTTYVRKQVAQVLGIADWQGIGEETGFFELGMDSLTSVELRNHLQKSLEISMAATAVMDYPTTADLATYLGYEVLGLELSGMENIESAEAAKESNLADEIEALSKDEALTLLAEELNL